MAESESTSSTDHSDAIVARIAQGDADALTAWFQQHRDSVYSFVFYRVGSDPDLAADVTQATFTKALERLGEFDVKRGEMITWLRYLSRNIIRSTLAGHRRGKPLQVVWDRLDDELRAVYEQIDSQPLPDEALQRQETRELVDMALANLPPQYRDVLEAKYVDNQPLETIALQRQVSIDSVKSMLRRARAAFRECFLTMARMEMSDV